MSNNQSGSAVWSPRILSILRIAVGANFILHGLEKVVGAPFGRMDHNFAAIHAWAGPIELLGGALLIMGLFTRTTAFITCGEMAVAYFHSWAPRGLFPINNGGELSVIYCFFFLWLVMAGGGAWSVDAWIASMRKRPMSAYDATVAPARS